MQDLELFRSAGPRGSAKRVPAPADGCLPAVLAKKPFVRGLNLILYQYVSVLLLHLTTQSSKNALHQLIMDFGRLFLFSHQLKKEQNHTTCL